MFDLNAIVSAAIATAVDARLTEVLQQHANIVGALAERIAALENNPAIGVDTVLEARVVALEQRMDNITTASDERIREIAEAAAEQVMEDHTSSYDHDDYDALHNEWGGEEASDFIRDRDIQDQIEEAVKEVLNNAHFTVSI
jgi:hypothetical protein